MSDRPKVNGVEIREPEQQHEKLWYSYIAAEVEKLGYGSVSITLTVKNKRVTVVKIHSEKTMTLDGNG